VRDPGSNKQYDINVRKVLRVWILEAIRGEEEKCAAEFTQKSTWT
jgi:hypothetical protein